MKLQKKIILYVFSAILIFACSNSDVTKPLSETEFSAYQIPGCGSNNILGKSSYLDTCFTYFYEDTLKIDFCVPGNSFI